MILKPENLNLKAISGFSLIEMMVVLTIFGIMTAVVLANFPAFRDKTALDLIAQEIATTIRQAQVYGIGTRSAGADPSTQFSAYGIYFDLNPAVLGKKNFYLYADKNPNDGYSDEDPNSVIENFAIRGAAEVKELCNDSNDCTQTLDILFQRFYPEASFINNPGSSYVKIILRSTRINDTRSIEVWNTGQIVVKPS
ncbi:MAG: prepilin-type N-terminal cleavage/methylation domain-containing protein [Patescibacteria group bacterium]